MTILRAVSRIRPTVVVDGGCSEPIALGAQVVQDPGFEGYVAATGRTEFARRGSGADYPNLLWPSDSTTALAFSPGGLTAPLTWSEREALASTDLPWTVSTANPRSGTYHVRLDNPNANFSIATLQSAHCWMCQAVGVGFPGWKVEAGMSISASMWGACSVDPITENNQGHLFCDLGFYDANYDQIGSARNTDSVVTAGIAYRQYVSVTTVPPGTYFMSLSIYPGRGNPAFPDAFFDVDDVALSITAA